MPVRGDEQRVPADEHCPRLLRLPEPEEHRDEARQQVAGASVRPTNRAWQRVEGAVRERVAVDHEERCGHAQAADSPVPVRRPARLARALADRLPQTLGRNPRALTSVLIAEIARLDRLARMRREASPPRQPLGARDRRGHERHARVERDPRRARVPAGAWRLRMPFDRRVPSGNITTAWPARQSSVAIVQRLEVARARDRRERRLLPG